MTSGWWTRRRLRRVLAQAKVYIAAGHVTIGNPAYHKGANAVHVSSCAGGLVFNWCRTGVGFGQLTIKAKNGQLVADTEAMGEAFAMDVIRQAFREGR